MTLQKKFIRFSQAVLIIAGIVLLAVHSSVLPSYYSPRFMGIMAFVYVFIIQLPLFVFRIPADDNAGAVKEKMFFRGQLQAALAVGLLLGGLGSLGLWGLYNVGIPYDKFVHFSFTAIMMVSGAYVLYAFNGWSLMKSIIFVAFVVGLSGVVWEFIEFGADRWLHVGYFGQLFDHDSMFDINTDLLGVIAGTGIIAWRQWLKRNLTS